MEKQTTTGNHASRIVWDNLEEWVRKKVQEFIQSLLKAEIVELLGGRQKSERRKAVDGSPAYWNGYGKERKLTLGCGIIILCRPRVRRIEERFESRVLPMFAQKAKGVNKLIPRLYLHGLSLSYFDLALWGLLGEDVPVSASPVARLKEGWQAEAKRDAFIRWCRAEGYRSAEETLVRDCNHMVTFYRFPQEHWRHLWMTNVVESPFAGLRLRTGTAKHCRKVENATAAIWKMLLLAEQRFHRLDAPESLIQVYLEFGFQERNEETKTKQKEVLAIV